MDVTPFLRWPSPDNLCYDSMFFCILGADVFYGGLFGEDEAAAGGGGAVDGGAGGGGGEGCGGDFASVKGELHKDWDLK